MGEFKYDPERWLWPDLDATWWFRAWNHWLNPLGNWLEPMPRPLGRVLDGNASPFYWLCSRLGLPTLGIWLFWNFRNFASNFSHYWIGIMPVGARYEHRSPEENGWQMILSDVAGEFQYRCWRKRVLGVDVRLPYWQVWLPFGLKAGLGWKASGAFGGHFRRA